MNTTNKNLKKSSPKNDNKVLLTTPSPTRRARRGRPRKDELSPSRILSNLTDPKELRSRSTERTLRLSPSRTKSLYEFEYSKSSSNKSSNTTKSATGKKNSEKKSTKKSAETFDKKGHLTPNRRSPIHGSPKRLLKQNESQEDTVMVLRRRKPVETLQVDDPSSDADSSVDESLEIKEKPKATVRGRSRADLASGFKREVSIELTPLKQITKRATRSSQHKESERIIPLVHFDSVSKKLSEFSDEDEIIIREPSVPKINEQKVKFLSYIGCSILITALPCLGIFLNFACNQNKDHCGFHKIPDNFNNALKTSNFFNLKASFLYITYFFISLIIAFLPFGGQKFLALPDKNGKFIYITNGLFSSVVILAIMIAVYFNLNIPLFDFIVANHFTLLTAAFLTGILLSIFSYARSYFVPISALNSNIINKPLLYNFVMGRELHPRIFNTIDLKLFSYRLLIGSELLMVISYLFKYFATFKMENDQDWIGILQSLPFTLLTYSILRIFTIFERLFYEYTWITSKEVQQEGFGYYMSVNYQIYPFLSTLTLRFLINQKIHLANWALILIILVYYIGRCISRISNNQKDSFTKNPYSPRFTGAETIPTNQGKKILVAGLWGIIRHPNYLGDIIAHCALIPFTFPNPPVLVEVLIILFLINRAQRDHRYCKHKYGNTWDRYCNRVRYLLIPKVY